MTVLKNSQKFINLSSNVVISCQPLFVREKNVDFSISFVLINVEKFQLTSIDIEFIILFAEKVGTV